MLVELAVQSIVILEIVLYILIFVNGGGGEQVNTPVFAILLKAELPFELYAYTR